tara:strand:- start:2816 stop:3040 length:225 start_codon:yes stop_codon:yes gene_type:complete
MLRSIVTTVLLTNILFIFGCATVEQEEKISSILDTKYRKKSNEVTLCKGRNRATMTCGYVDRHILEEQLRRMRL